MPKSSQEINDLHLLGLSQESAYQTDILNSTQIEVEVTVAKKEVPELVGSGTCAGIGSCFVPPILAYPPIIENSNEFLAGEASVAYSRPSSRNPQGYTHIWHTLFEHPAYLAMSLERRYIWLEILTRVAWGNGKYYWNGKEFNFEKGDIYFSERDLAKELKITYKTLRGACKHFSLIKFWAQKRAQPLSHFSICYSEFYIKNQVDKGAEKGADRAQTGRTKELLLTTLIKEKTARIADDPALALARRFSLFLYEQLKKINEKIQKPKGDGWAKPLAKLFRDKSINVTIEQAEEVCQFIIYSHQHPTLDGFSWSKAVQSGDKFAKHFSTMWTQMQDAKSRPAKGVPAFHPVAQTKELTLEEKNQQSIKEKRKVIQRKIIAELDRICTAKNGPGKWIKFGLQETEVFEFGNSVKIAYSLSDDFEMVQKKMKDWGWI